MFKVPQIVVVGALAVLSILTCLDNPTLGAPRREVDFARDVFPLLQRACVECHGKAKQEGGLRLDERAAALRGGDSGPAWKPGDAAASELLRRIALPRDDAEAMPARGALLTKAQIETLRRWIESGANWPTDLKAARHWAYVSPRRLPAPPTKNTAWARTEIDQFVLSRLESEGLAPSPEAERATLIRRLSLDLIGLPPTPVEVDQFVQDTSPEAYERLVERLLASPEFGVRWARPWLDAARYADSHGFQRDDFRDLWPYRDWVVAALNADMPFDQFTIEQLAGDLLPTATESQRIATGFNRSAPTNVEAGSDPEETRVNQVFDRVNTLGMVWLGTTLECCQCHDHKYDPFTQRDYYRLFAYFNQTALEADRANPKTPGSIRFLGGDIRVTDLETSARRDKLQREQAQLRAKLAVRGDEFARPDPDWETALLKSLDKAPREHVLTPHDFDSLGGATHEVLADGSVLLSGEAPDKDTYTVVVRTELNDIRAIKLEALTDPSLPGRGPGRGDAVRPNFVLHSFTLTAAPKSGGKAVPINFVRATADFAQKNFDPAGAIDDDPKTGWAIKPKFHEPHWAVFETAEPLGFESGSELRFELVQNLGASRTLGRLRLSAITGRPGETAVPAEVAAALKVGPERRTAVERDAIVQLRQRQDTEYARLSKEVARLEAEGKQVVFPTSLVMQELSTPRATTIFKRGDFRDPGESVEPRTPEILPALPSSGAAENRLALARWLVHRDNPLVARVVVNRWWGELFGHGLVLTPEDFGIKGEPPTHPELLDALAVEFVESGWSMKHLLRTIVLSATYRQSSRLTSELLSRDDRNLLYARGPRFRLDAEAIRDNALAISGLLSRRGGGTPIRPYQPDGVWIKVGGERYDYVVSPGDEKYRRGLYVVLKRGAPYPSFVNFDANARLACRVQRPRTNTPLQALTLLNDPVYVEASEAFARRVLAERPAAGNRERLTHAFTLATSRRPSQDELSILSQLLDAQVTENKGADELSAWVAVCAALLNLDETITKK